MRLFVAFDIEEEIRQKIMCFMESLRDFAAEVRWIRVDSLHITLKFIGEQREEALPSIQQTLHAVHSAGIEINFRGFGFFPTAKSARVFWAGVEAGPELASLASKVDVALSHLNIPKEEHGYRPHLTLARGGSHRRGSGTPHQLKTDAPSRSFQRLQEKLASMPDPEFGTMTAQEFFLYQSRLTPQGSRYSRLAAFPLRPVTGSSSAH